MGQTVSHRLDQLSKGQDELSKGQDRLSKGQDKIDVMLENQIIRQANGWNRAPHHELQPLARDQSAEAPPPAPQLGDLPPEGMFPETRGAAQCLTAAQLDALEQHYGRLFRGPSTAARCNAFQVFTG